MVGAKIGLLRLLTRAVILLACTQSLRVLILHASLGHPRPLKKSRCGDGDTGLLPVRDYLKRNYSNVDLCGVMGCRSALGPCALNSSTPGPRTPHAWHSGQR